MITHRRLKIFACLLVLCGFFAACNRLHAQSCVLPANATQAQVATAFGYAGAATCTGTATNQTVQFSAGTTPVSGAGLSMPCNSGVVITGPSIANFATPLAILDGTGMGSSNYIFGAGSGCTGLTIKNLGFKGAGSIYIGGTASNITLTNNTITAIPDVVTSPNCCGGPNAINFDGSLSTSVSGSGSTAYLTTLDQNITGTYNTIGDSSSCPNSFATGEDNSACTGLWMNMGECSNCVFRYNHFYHMNEGLKWVQLTGFDPGATNGVFKGGDVEYNYFQSIHRISFEDQVSVPSNGAATIFAHNAILVDGGLPYFGTLTVSLACCMNGLVQGSSTYPAANPALYVTDNVMVNSVNQGESPPPYGYEYWGVGSLAQYNLVEGYIANNFEWETASNTGAAINYNQLCWAPGYTGAGYISAENLSNEPTAPSQVGNVTGSCTAASQSIAPTISPASGNISGSTTVTLAVPAQSSTSIIQGTNQSIYYTTDGSTPSTSSTLYTGPFTVSGATTVKAISQWGVAPQPTSWPANYGYVPSSVTTATYTTASGPNCALAAGWTASQLQTASSYAASGTCGNTASVYTVSLPAATSTINATIYPACSGNASHPVVISGPVANNASPYTTVNPTAIINDSSLGVGGNAFAVGACTGLTIQNVWVQGAGILAVNGTAYGVSLLYSKATGIPDSLSGGNCCNGAAGLNLNGSLASATSTANGQTVLQTYYTGINMTGNSIGDSTSCTNAFANTYKVNDGCGGIQASVGELQNAVISGNLFTHLNEAIHVTQVQGSYTGYNSQSTCDNVVVQNNYILTNARNPIEFQCASINHPSMVQHNAFNAINGVYSGVQIGFTIPCCTEGFLENQGTGITGPAIIENDNVIVASTPGGQNNYGFEFWGQQPLNEYNLVQGYVPNNIDYENFVGTGTLQYDYLCWASGFTGSGFVVYENSSGNNTPPPLTQTGIVTGTTCNATASVAPTIAPGTGTQSFPLTVTLAVPVTLGSSYNSGQNTSVWYTTDGSTPSPGGSGSTLYTGPITLSGPATIQAVGMWGTGPAPLSWPSGYGYTPSAVVSATYASGGTVSLTGVTLTSVIAVTSIEVGQTLQMTATCAYSDGSTTNCNSTDAHGNAVSTWNSSNTAVLGISSSGVATGVSAGSATLTATVSSFTSPAYALAVTAPTVSLTGLSLATTGGVSTLAPGATNQLIATCSYSDGSNDNCTTADTHGNDAGFTSSATSVATVNATGGLLTAVAGGTTNLQASVTFGAVTSQAGNTSENTAGTTSPGYINATYLVMGAQTGGYTVTGCSFYLPAQTLTVGAKYDCGLIQATSPTTMSANWNCVGTYTVTAASQPAGFVTVTPTGCGTIAAGSAWWMAVNTSQSGTSDVGFLNCAGASCTGAAPTAAGTGTYPCAYVAAPYGTYSGLTTTLNTGGCGAGQVQSAQYMTLGQPTLTSSTVPLTVTAAPPTLTSVLLLASGSPTTLMVGSTLQFSAQCTYSTGATTNCTSTDVYGNAVSTWRSSNGTILTISSSGLATAVAAGSASLTAVVGSVTSAGYNLTATAVSVTLSSVSLSTAGGVTGIFVGANNQLAATCVYSDGSSTNCTSVDSHGNVAGSYTSSNPSAATVNAASGLAHAVAPGTTNFTATAGGHTSPARSLTVLAVPTGIYTITITGPVKFSGTVRF